MTSEKPFVLVDGSSYLFRAYHALPPLSNSKGEPTGAIVGTINMLRKLMDEYQPDYMAVVFDASGPTFRDEIYPAYKAHRPPMPDDLRAQIGPLHRIVEAIGLPLLEIPGVEADDVIGTLAMQAAEQGMGTLISTGDKDFAQLVNDRITLINTMSNSIMGPKEVVEKFGVRPEQIIDFLALVGDTVDNVPGVPKCGSKTAAKWLAQYGDLNTLMERADEIKGKIGENLRASLDQLPKSRQLVAIKRDVILDREPLELVPAKPDIDALREWYGRIESNRLLATLEDNTGAQPEETLQSEFDYQLILEPQDLEAWMEKLESAETFSFDTETTSLDYMHAELVGASFAVEAGEAAYVPVAHNYPGAPDQLDRDQVLRRLKPLLENAEKKKIGQNLKYDMNVLARYGIDMQGIDHDTMLESYVLDSTATRHDMDSLAARYLEHQTIKYEDVAGKGAKQLSFDQVPLEQAGPYAAEDAEVTLRLHQTLWPRLEQESDLAALYRTIEMPLVPVLSRMERAGVRIDTAMLATQSGDLAARLHKLEQQAYDSVGHPFNLSSPKQIGEILFQELGLTAVTKTPKGAPSTAESVLEQLAGAGHALPALILEHRGLAKLKSTYLDKLPLMVNPATGRVHTSYHQAVAATGRLSSSDPNLQNIPIRTDDGRRIRQAFVAETGARIMAADYSQIELRIMAHLSDDPGLLKAFAEGRDIHRATAGDVFEVPPDEVTADQRRSAKAINFGLIYGMSAFGLARQLGIERRAAQEYVDLYFQRYPGVKDFMERTREQARRQGYVKTLFGRRLYLQEINARNQQRRAGAERTAINAPMQGTAADIIKRAMIAVDTWLRKEKPPVRMIMQVHDELVFEVREDLVEQAKTSILELMEGAVSLKVSLVVDAGVGDSWEAAH